MNATGHETATAGSGNSGEVSREERRMGENGDEQDETAEQGTQTPIAARRYSQYAS